MSGFPILDLVAGLIFIYFLLSIICSSAVEIMLTASKVRAKVLAHWLTSIFNKPITLPKDSKSQPKTLGEALLDHCTVTALSDKGKSNSYLDAKNFVTALLEKVTFDPANPTAVAASIDEYITAISKTDILPGELQRVFLIYANEAKDSLADLTGKTTNGIQLFRNKIEAWYDSSMDRVSGALKTKYSRPFTFIMATVITLVLNADSISISQYLYSNPEARVKLAGQAYDATKNEDFIKQVAQLKKASGLDKEDSLALLHFTDSINTKFADIGRAKAALETALPLGWQKADVQKFCAHPGAYTLTKLAGLVATILAIMMGAPFWFDVLNKIANLRGSGKKPEGGAKEKTT